MEFKTLEIDDLYHDYRLDKTLLSLFPWLSFGECQQLLRKKLVKLNDKKADSKTRLSKGDMLSYPEFILDKKDTHEPRVNKNFETFIAPNILFEDQHLLIFNKPQGLAVQGGTKTRTHIDQILKSHYKSDPDTTPLLVHRLDQATSGILIVAKSKIAASKMGALFKEKDNIKKTYIACCWGDMNEKLAEIHFPLEKKLIQSVERMHFAETGQEALTHISVIKKAQNKSWVKLSPITGKKHQLRAHLAMIGHPIIGDSKYNVNICLLKKETEDKQKPFEPQFRDSSKTLFLHAYRIAFKHPITRENLDITAPLPDHMAKIQSEL